jgi:hypothetical protein
MFPTVRQEDAVPLFSRRPKLRDCFVCSQAVEESLLFAHYKSHLIEVTDNNGQQAFTFECPRCGLMDQAWGGGRPDPESNGAIALQAHLMLKHSVRM